MSKEFEDALNDFEKAGKRLLEVWEMGSNPPWVDKYARNLLVSLLSWIDILRERERRMKPV